MLLVTGPKYQLAFETFALETIKTNRIHRDHHDFQWTEPMMRASLQASLLAVAISGPAG